MNGHMHATVLPKLFSAVFLTLFTLAPVRAQEAPPWRDWQAPLLRDHALSGKIWSARDKAFVTPQTLVQAVSAARFVLIGEVHDNADHHRLQAWLIEQSAANTKPDIVMEMIAEDQAPALRAYLARPGANAAGLGAALKWEARGWPSFRIYQPIAEAALRRGMPIHAGDIDKLTLKKISKNGLNALGAERRSSLFLDKPLGEALQKALLDDLYESHCELVPRKALSGMSDVQRLRDAVLADSLINAAGGGSAILIAGNGHVRADRAVPWYLSRRVSQANIVTVMLLEVEKTAKAPEDLTPTGPGGKTTADYVWFTPRADRKDPCGELRKRFGK